MSLGAHCEICAVHVKVGGRVAAKDLLIELRRRIGSSGLPPTPLRRGPFDPIRRGRASSMIVGPWDFHDVARGAIGIAAVDPDRFAGAVGGIQRAGALRDQPLPFPASN